MIKSAIALAATSLAATALAGPYVNVETNRVGPAETTPGNYRSPRRI